MREVAFVRSPVAHARIRAVHVPEAHRGAVFTAADLAGVKPIRAATALRGFKHSSEPILATAKVRYVGEIIAMCVAENRAEAEDIAALVELDLEELPAVADMLDARKPGAALVHEEWGDNVFIEAFEDARPRRNRAARCHQGDARDSAPRAIACFRSRAAACSPIGMHDCAF